MYFYKFAAENTDTTANQAQSQQSQPASNNWSMEDVGQALIQLVSLVPQLLNALGIKPQQSQNVAGTNQAAQLPQQQLQGGGIAGQQKLPSRFTRMRDVLVQNQKSHWRNQIRGVLSDFGRLPSEDNLSNISDKVVNQEIVNVESKMAHKKANTDASYKIYSFLTTPGVRGGLIGAGLGGLAYGLAPYFYFSTRTAPGSFEDIAFGSLTGGVAGLAFDLVLNSLGKLTEDRAGYSARVLQQKA